MTAIPLMPKATAVWLLDNTSLTFEQIADFCKLHVLEIKAIADGDAAQGIKGLDPISTGQLSREQIVAAEGDTDIRLTMSDPKVRLPEAKKKKGPRYTPVSRRQDRPNAILWLVRNRQHWNSTNIKPVDPVTLGLATQLELDAVVRKAADKKAKDDARKGVDTDGPSLRPASETGVVEEAPVYEDEDLGED